MGKRYLLDTNTVLDFMGDKLPNNVKTVLARIIDDEINLSVINKIELLGFSKLEQDLIDFVNFSNICPLDDEIVEKTIEVRKLYKIKLPDAVIVATAMHYKYVLVTNNIKDFKGIKGVKVISPGNL